MALLAAALLAGSIAAVVIGVRRLFLRERYRSGWWWVCAAVALGFGGGAVLEWDRSSRWELAFDYAESAVTTCGAVLAVAGVIRIWRVRASVRGTIRGVLVLSAPVLAVVLAGHALRVLPRVVDDGWWAAVPTPVLVELSPWLPERAIGHSGWTIEGRIARHELWDWERERLRSRLEKRFRSEPSAAALAEWSMVPSEGETGDALAAILFEKMAVQFLDGAPAARTEAAHVLWDYLPTNWKICHPHIGAKEGPRVTKGRVPRLLELAAGNDFMDSVTAIDLLAVTGDDGAEAVPTLVRVSKRRGPSDRYNVTETLDYLAATAPAVRERLIAMTEGPDAYERILAIESLCQWNWHDARVAAHLAKLAREGDPVVAAIARRYSPLSYSSSYGGNGPDFPWNRAVFDFLDSQSPDRAGYLAGVHDGPEYLAPYLPRTIRALSDPDAGVRAAACGVLWQVAGYPGCKGRLEEARPRLQEMMLGDSHLEVREAAQSVTEAMDRK